MRECEIEKAFVKAVEANGGLAYKLNSQSMNGLPDRLVLFPMAKAAFVELKAPGERLRPLQRKRANQLLTLGFPVLCIDQTAQIKTAIDDIKSWVPGKRLREGIEAQKAREDMMRYLLESESQEPESPEDEIDFSDVDSALFNFDWPEWEDSDFDF